VKYAELAARLGSQANVLRISICTDNDRDF
jgi:hypothetical protein